MPIYKTLKRRMSKHKGKKKTWRVKTRGAIKRAMTTNRNMHAFRRYTNEVRHSVSGTTSAFAYECLFTDVRGYTDFTDLYDRYQITRVVMKFRIVNNPDNSIYINGTNGSGTVNAWNGSVWYPCMYYCKDYDDSATESLEQLKERANTKRIILKPNVFHKIVLKPAVTMQTYRTATTTGYAPKWNQWIDMAQTDVPHYGLKYVIDCSAQDPNDAQPYIVERTTQIFFKCKDVR